MLALILKGAGIHDLLIQAAVLASVISGVLGPLVLLLVLLLAPLSVLGSRR
jgi:hypothetical protein